MIKRSLNWITRNLFSTGPQVATTIFGSFTALASVLGAWELLSRFQKWSEPRASAEVFYLWVTFITVTLLAVLYLVLLSRVTDDLNVARKDVATAKNQLAGDQRSRAKEVRGAVSNEEQKCDRVQVVLHRTVEEVRRAVLDPQEVKWHRPLDLLRTYVKDYYDVGEVCITVKALRNGKLVTLARVGEPDGNRGPEGSEQQASESFVYATFSAPTKTKYKQQIVIQDAWNLPVRNAEYIDRAMLCGFRSIIAFPLRGPREMPSEPYTTNQVFGFLAFDSPKPNAFDRWFDEKVPDHDWGQQNLTPKRSFDVFYGVADAAATMAKVLARQPTGRQHASPDGSGGMG